MRIVRRPHPLACLTLALAPMIAIACQDAKAPSSQVVLQQTAPRAPTSASAPVPPLATASVATQIASVDEAALDKSAKPCDDFYQFACGGWKKATPIPDDEAAWYRSFNVINEHNEATLRSALEAFAKGERASEPSAKALGEFYDACMDEDGIEKADLSPLREELAKIDAAKDSASLTVVFAQLQKDGVDAPFALSSGQDFKDATLVIGQIEQAGLGLPDRDYYLKDDGKKKALRAKYEELVEHVFVLAGEKPDDAKKGVKTVLKIERALAHASMSKEDRREPKKVYHRQDRTGLKSTAPNIGWDGYFKEIGFPRVTAINVAEPDFLRVVSDLVKSLSVAEWRTYLLWHTIRTFQRQLPAKFVDESMKFRAALTGQAKLPPRWKRCVRAADEAMGEALGQAFVKATLGAEGKANVEAMIRGIEHAMNLNLNRLTWMDDATRARALEKLGLIANMVAYPDRWRSYDALKIERGAYLANTARSAAFELNYKLAKIGKPVERLEWQMSPPTVNAYYEPTLNQMVFPAGILQPPFYSNDRGLPANFGSIGMVMGHELTHGFDDEGRQFNAKGNLVDWWSPAINAEFEKRASCVEKQYSNYEISGGDKVNGKLTLGENIADLGGVKLAYAAFKAELEKASSASFAGFSPEQQFFLGYAQGWCVNERDEFLRMMVATNPHAPSHFRVIGPLSNLPEFANAFSCKSGDKMVREGANRCEVW
jgi:putative endopeptidase